MERLKDNWELGIGNWELFIKNDRKMGFFTVTKQPFIFTLKQVCFVYVRVRLHETKTYPMSLHRLRWQMKISLV
jgi:hypothetical protein